MYICKIKEYRDYLSVLSFKSNMKPEIVNIVENIFWLSPM